MKTAVVLFNLGGPDSPAAVEPFLRNLFSDRRIIGLPNPFRAILAKLIARKRAPVAAEIYRHLGGRSPLLENTEAQAKALEARLENTRTFIAMSYWHPMADEAAQAVREYAPDRIVLLPLYPQWSTTTGASATDAWHSAIARTGFSATTTTVCCYPTLPGYIATMARLTAKALDEAATQGVPRVLFSAHGLPRKIIASGDPYQWQCEETTRAIVTAMNREFEWLNTYQSRVGPLKWIGPATDDEIRRAGADKRPLVIVPIAFVSEHSETLVELDIEYRHLADQAGVPAYVRVPTASIEADFIEGLAGLVKQALLSPLPCLSQNEGRLCPRTYRKCAIKR